MAGNNFGFRISDFGLNCLYSAIRIPQSAIPLVLLGAGVAGCAGGQPIRDDPDPVLRDALHAVGLTRADLMIRTDHVPDAGRLGVTRRVLEQPLVGGTVAGAIAEGLASPSVANALILGRRYLEVGLRDISGGGEDGQERLPGLPGALADLLAPLVAELATCRAQVAAERDRFSVGERRRLEELIALVDPEQRVTEGGADSLLVLARRLDRGALVAVAVRLLAARDRFLDGVGLLPPEAFRVEGAPVRVVTPAGVVMIGGAGDDTYREAAALMVDLGGDDRYEGDAGAASAGLPVSLCIDLNGSDVYTAGQGRGILGVGMLLDLEGDDRYEGGWGSQGSGFAGVGILEDRAGNDRYRAGPGSQGFGMYGIGILCDLGGADRYEGDLLVQGAAGPGGAGILCDGEGNDAYEAGGRYRDFREEGVHLSMAQGFGRGLRPLTAGGIGILYDGGGDDHYRAEYFAQGAAHLSGTGMLIDRDGDDRYEARRYAQGCGTHRAVGVLMEGRGDDRYTLWGVGQGCGHDLSVGMLIDRLGDDRYRAVLLAQGAGNANGIGLLDDAAGNDRYVAEQKDAQGYGNPSRAYGSIGIFIDRAGEDHYQGSGGEGQLWTGGMYGAGIDAPLVDRMVIP